MRLSLRFVGGVDPRLRLEIIELGKWLRRRYPFPNPLEIRLIHERVLTDFDGAACALRWWQSSRGLESVTGEIAAASFPENLEDGGPETAFPTVIAAVGRLLEYYYQAVRGAPIREDPAERWGDRMLDAYTGGSRPPPPWKGASIMKQDHE